MITELALDLVLSLIIMFIAFVGFMAGCLFTEWRSHKQTASWLEQFNQRAARPNTRKGV